MTREEQAAYVEQKLGRAVVCDRCKATLASYAKTCSADLGEWCPGFTTIEAAWREARSQ